MSEKCKIGVVNKNRYLTCLPANDLIIDLLDNKIMVNYFSHKDTRYKKVGLRLWSVTVKNITTQHLQVYNQTLLSPSGNLGKSFWNVSSGARINLTFAFLRIISLILSNCWKDKILEILHLPCVSVEIFKNSLFNYNRAIYLFLWELSIGNKPKENIKDP